MSNRSISSRFLVSALANFLRGGLSFITTIIIARDFGPKEYGDYAFLLGTFVGVMSLLDLGTSSAFQTFVSQKERGKMFLLSYAGWQLLQVLLALLFIGLIIPDTWFEKIWLGHEKKLVLLVLVAVFMQQSVWKTMVQIGESKRLTHRIQLTNLSIAIVHLLLVIGCWIGGFLSVQLVFGLIFVEYLIFVTIAYKILFISKLKSEVFDFRLTLKEYVRYCSPSYPMTSNFNIPHGLAVSITIKEVIKFNSKVAPNKVNQIIEECGASSLDDFISKLIDLMHSINLPTRLRDLSLREQDIETILADSIHPDRMKNNPAQLNKEDIRTILTNTF